MPTRNMLFVVMQCWIGCLATSRAWPSIEPARASALRFSGTTALRSALAWR